MVKAQRLEVRAGRDTAGCPVNHDMEEKEGTVYAKTTW